LYELAGVVYNSTNKWFYVGRLEAADAKYVGEFFHRLMDRGGRRRP
jgi:hypothetical protein